MKILISLLYALSAFNQVRLTESDSGVGTIYTYPVADVPEGFLECNGSEYKMVDYPELYNVLGGDYGDRSEGGFIYFNVPDYRGYFLRGWDHGAGIDPDRSSRLDRGDGTSGDLVGTKQSFALEHMTGNVDVSSGLGQRAEINNQNGVLTFRNTGTVYNAGAGGFSGNRQMGLKFDSSLQVQTSTETRPKNINVLYIIQAKEIANDTLQGDFITLQRKVESINSTYSSAVALLSESSDNADAQHDSYLSLLDNRTAQIIATQVQEITTLQQSINILNRTYIVNLENQVVYLQQEIMMLKQRLNATASPTPSPTNRVPVVNEQIPTKYATVGVLFEYIVPQETFSDSDEDILTLAASLVDDSVLPLWLNFNPDSKEFLGVPSTEDIANLFIKVTATDLSGAQVSEAFSLIVQSAAHNDTTYASVQIAPSNHLSVIAIALSGLNLGILGIGFCIYFCKRTSQPKGQVRSVSQVNAVSNSPLQEGTYTANIPMGSLPSQPKVKGTQDDFDAAAYFAGDSENEEDSKEDDYAKTKTHKG